jgi:hypothetical protein
MTAKRTQDIHVRICDEADAVLELLATSERKNKTQVAAELLERSLLGEGYALKIAARRFARLGFDGIAGDQ